MLDLGELAVLEYPSIEQPLGEGIPRNIAKELRFQGFCHLSKRDNSREGLLCEKS